VSRVGLLEAAAFSALTICLALELSVLSFGLDDLDEGYFLEQASRVVAGQVPYRDFESLYTPGLTYVHAAVFAAAGEPAIILMRGVAWLGRAAEVALMYALARPLVSPLWAALAPLFVLVGLDAAPDRWNTHPGWPSAAAGLLTMWTVAEWARAERPAKWLVASGAAAGLTFLFKQNAGVFISAAVGLFVLLHARGQRLGSVLLLIGGFVAITVPWLVPLIWSLGGDVRALAHLVGAGDTAALFYPPDPLNLLAVGGLVCAVVLAVRERRAPHAWRLRWYLIGGCALFLTQYPRMDTLHLAWSAPVLFVLGAVLLSRLLAVPAALGVLVVAACAVPMLQSRVQPFVGQTLVSVEGVPSAHGLRVPRETRAHLEGVTGEVRSRTAPGEPIFVYPTSPLLYVAAERPNPTRFAHLHPGAANRSQVELVLRQLDAHAVRTAVVDDFWTRSWGPAGDNQPIEDYLATHFRVVARFGAYQVLERIGSSSHTMIGQREAATPGQH